MKRTMCIYCAKWFPEKETWLIEGQPYCEKCFPEVLDAVKKLPWNKDKKIEYERKF